MEWTAYLALGVPPVKRMLIGGNWKCNGTIAEIDKIIRTLNLCGRIPLASEVVLAVPSIHIVSASKLLRKEIAVASEDVGINAGFGAYTGEVSAQMLLDVGVRWTLTGHSERRVGFGFAGETSEVVARKTSIAIKAGMSVILCIGEHLADREGGTTMNVCIAQLRPVVDLLSHEDWKHVVIAYEPVWAIGTGKVATPIQAEETHLEIRSWLAVNVSAVVAKEIRIIYGGSVNGANCKSLISCANIDGFLVGGASLKPEFVDIIKLQYVMIPKDYNSRLKPIQDKGLCGDPEMFDSSDVLTGKMLSLVSLMKTSSYPIVFTGAGISTSSGIPDFRGPNGVWTRELKASEIMGGTIDIGSNDLGLNTFNGAKPSFTHRAIACLTHLGIVKHVVSQNVDGLHLRSGVLEDNLSELHGNIFKEKCERCGKEYLRDFDVGGMGLKRTGRRCGDAIGCNGNLLSSKGSKACEGLLRDCAVDWDTELPTRVFERAHLEHDKADLVICIGTSLRIRPAGNMPLRVLRPNSIRPPDRTGHIVIINLQKTHLDKKSSLKISFYCDEVLRQLCDRLGITIHPPSDSRSGLDAGSNSNVDVITSDSYSIQKGSVIESILSPTGSCDFDYRASGSSDVGGIELLRRSSRTGSSSHTKSSKDFKGINQCSTAVQQATSTKKLPSKTARRKRAAVVVDDDEQSREWNKGPRRED